MRIFIVAYLLITAVLNVQTMTLLSAAEDDLRGRESYSEKSYQHDEQSGAAQEEDEVLPEEDAGAPGYYEEGGDANEGQGEFLQEEDGPLYEEPEDEVNDAPDGSEEEQSAPAEEQHTDERG